MIFAGGLGGGGVQGRTQIRRCRRCVGTLDVVARPPGHDGLSVALMNLSLVRSHYLHGPRAGFPAPGAAFDSGAEFSASGRAFAAFGLYK